MPLNGSTGNSSRGLSATAEVSNPGTEEAEKKRKNELRSLRRLRTIQKNALQGDLSRIRDLHTQNPVFPVDMDVEAMVKRISQHAAAIRDFNSKISLLIEDELEWNQEATSSEQFAREAVAAVAAVETASSRLQRQVTMPTVPSPGAITPGPTDPSIASGTGSVISDAQSGPEHHRASTMGIIQPPRVHATSSLTNKLTREYDMTPRIFSGNRLQFRTFIAEFEEYVGRRSDVSALRKLIILRKFLQGEPLIIVEALELNETNYNVALSHLEKNYSRVGSEKLKVIGKLRNLPTVSEPYDYAAVSRLVTAVQSHISVLAVNGVHLPEVALTLLNSLQSALPMRVRQDFLDQQHADEKYSSRSIVNSLGDVAAIEDQQTKQSAGAKAAKEVEAFVEFLRQRLRNIELLKKENCVPSQSDKKLPENQRFPVADRSYLGEWKPEAPPILLGMDQYHELMIDSTPELVVNTIRGHRSHFGWVLGGPITERSSAGGTSTNATRLARCVATMSLKPPRLAARSEEIQRLWTLSTIGMADSASSSSMSANDESAIQQLRATLTRAENRYTVGVPKRSTFTSSKNSRAIVAQRLDRKLWKLEENPARYQRSHEGLMGLVEQLRCRSKLLRILAILPIQLDGRLLAWFITKFPTRGRLPLNVL